MKFRLPILLPYHVIATPQYKKWNISERNIKFVSLVWLW